jgi:hypothetical protein
MKYLNFIKKFLFLPTLYNIAGNSSYVISLNYRKNFYMQILYWYFNAVKRIKFNYNYNDLFKFFNSSLQLLLVYTEYFNILYKIILFKKFRFKLFLKIKKLFKYIFIQCIKFIKYYKNKKYFLFSFKIKRKKYFLQKSSNFLLKKKINILFILNNILFNLLLFLIKN